MQANQQPNDPSRPVPDICWATGEPGQWTDINELPPASADDHSILSSFAPDPLRALRPEDVREVAPSEGSGITGTARSNTAPSTDLPSPPQV